MIHNPEKAELREMYFKIYRKAELNEPLAPFEKQILQLIKEHPEYNQFFSNPEKYHDYDFKEENPFLHLSLHLTLLEQVSTNRPKGITAAYKDIITMMGDAHHAEHHIIEILANEISQMINQKKLPDEKNYLKQLKKLLKKGCGHSH